MLKYLTHKMKNQSISEDNNLVQGKIDERDSGTESDGDLEHENNFDIAFERCKDLDMSSKLLAISPTNTTSATILAQHQDTTTAPAHHHLMYDQHSSEEELEVINGSSSSLTVPTAATLKSILSVRGTNDSVASETSSVEPEMFEDSPKRASSTQSETRKRSLPHNSDEEVRNLLDLIPAPVNFRSTPPSEAIRKIDFRVYRLNPMALIETSKGIENIKISCDSSNNITGDNNYKLTNNEDDMKQNDCIDISNNGSGDNNDGDCCGDTASFRLLGENNGSCNSNNGVGIGNNHQQYQNKFSTHFKNNSSSSSSSMSSVSLGDVRSVSPPAKVSRRPPRTHQRLHRPHRPCLDFDKMQQVR